MIANLLNIRNIAIIAGLCATAFAVQSLRINWLKTDKRELKIELLEQKQALKEYELGELDFKKVIAEISAENQQCAAGKKINEANSKAELTRQQQRIADLQSKYDKAKDYAGKQKKDKPYVCGYNVYIDSELVNWLRKDKVHNQD